MKDYFEIERKILRIFGISLNESESKAYVIYSYTALIMFIYLYCIVSVAELFKENDFEDFSVTFVYISCMALAAAKVAIVLLNRAQLRSVVENVQTGIFAPNYKRGGETEEKLIKECIQFNNLQRMVYLSADATSLAGSIINALVKRLRSTDYRDWDLGFGSFSIIDITKSPNYEIVMIYQDIAFIFCGLTFLTTDIMFVGILSHLSVQFKILQNNLRHIVENTKRKFSENTGINADVPISKHDLQVSLKEIVTHHLSIIDLADRVEKIYRPLLLIIYVSNMLILCFGVYMATILTDATKRFVFISGQTSVCCQLFVTCYWCDRMTTESVAVGNAAYDVQFVDTSPSFQKDLAFIIQRSMRPTVMTAGKFFNITLPSFLKILQAAYSFLMVVQKKSKESI